MDCVFVCFYYGWVELEIGCDFVDFVVDVGDEEGIFGLFVVEVDVGVVVDCGGFDLCVEWEIVELE